MKVSVHHILLSLSLAAGLSSVALADGDSSSDADGGFVNKVTQSQAVIIQVPINSRGEEMTEQADMRLYQGQDLGTSGDFEAAFAVSHPAANQPEVSEDSSTSGYGWSSWRSCSYYNNYRPTYYSYGHTWNYYSPYYRNYYNSDRFYGYRYYYYRRCW